MPSFCLHVIKQFCLGQTRLIALIEENLALCLCLQNRTIIGNRAFRSNQRFLKVQQAPQDASKFGHFHLPLKSSLENEKQVIFLFMERSLYIAEWYEQVSNILCCIYIALHVYRIPCVKGSALIFAQYFISQYNFNM